MQDATGGVGRVSGHLGEISRGLCRAVDDDSPDGGDAVGRIDQHVRPILAPTLLDTQQAVLGCILVGLRLVCADPLDPVAGWRSTVRVAWPRHRGCRRPLYWMTTAWTGGRPNFDYGSFECYIV